MWTKQLQCVHDGRLRPPAANQLLPRRRYRRAGRPSNFARQHVGRTDRVSPHHTLNMASSTSSRKLIDKLRAINNGTPVCIFFCAPHGQQLA